MIEHEAKQGTPEWMAARCGIPTASEFSRVVTPAKAELSRQAESYMLRLLGEWLTGEAEDTYVSDAMSRGFMLQPEALEWYSLTTDREVRECGLCLRDDRLVGASPDAFVVGANAIVEVKCPLYTAHMRTLVYGDLPVEYAPQVQGQLWLTGAERCDFVSYHPKLPSRLVRVARDEEYITKLAHAVDTFVGQMLELRELLRKNGYAEAA